MFKLVWLCAIFSNKYICVVNSEQQLVIHSNVLGMWYLAVVCELDFNKKKSTQTLYVNENDSRSRHRQSAHSWHAYINASPILILTVKIFFWCLRYSFVSHISFCYKLNRSTRDFVTPECNLCLAPKLVLAKSLNLLLLTSGKNFFFFIYNFSRPFVLIYSNYTSQCMKH